MDCRHRICIFFRLLVSSAYSLDLISVIELGNKSVKAWRSSKDDA